VSHPGVEIKSIEGITPVPDTKFGREEADSGIETVDRIIYWQ